VLYGFSELRVARLTAVSVGGKKLSLSPQLPPARIRRRAPWLRSFRYFVFFHPAAADIRRLTAFDKNGQVIDRLEKDGFQYVELPMPQ
jgi:hypothetical protein